MPTAIQPSSGVPRDFPMSIERVGENNILLATGVDSMYRWNGLRGAIETAGIEAPTVAPTVTSSGTGSITIASPGVLVYYLYVDNDGNYSDLSPASTRFTCTGKSLITFSGIPASTDPKVQTKRVYRTVQGDDRIAYFDNDLTNAATSISTNNTEAQLQTREALVLEDSDGVNQANKNAPPPNHKAALAVHLGRVFAAVEVNYTRGNVQVTNGSSTVVGIDTRWTSAMNGRTIYVAGAAVAYTLTSISAVNAQGRQTATLQRSGVTTAWSQTTNKFAKYAVRSEAGNRRTLLYSEAAKPESWPAANLITLQETGDEITAVVSHQSFLYVVERSHIHRLTYNVDPAADGAIFLLANRGCINHRCWVIVEDQIMMLDQQGIHAYDGGRASQQIATPVRDLFVLGDEGLRINWRASKLFHAVHYPKQEAVRWFVSMSGAYLPRHAIVYHYRTGRWWVEEYQRPFGCSAVASFGQQRVLIGGPKLDVFALDNGTLDGPGASGDVVLDVSSASVMQVVYVFGPTPPTEGVVGSTIAVVSGKGKGQVRKIVAIDTTTRTITLAEPWFNIPDSTSKLVIGAINWEWKSGWMEWPGLETVQQRKVEVFFNPATDPATMDLEVYSDFSATPNVLESRRSSIDNEGVSFEKGDTDIVVDLTRKIGRAEQQLDDGRSPNTAGEKMVAVDLNGFSTRHGAQIAKIDVAGAVSAGGGE